METDTLSISLAFFSMPGGTEWLVIGLIALLLFGRRLPEVAHSFGQSIIAFKKGMREVKGDFEPSAKLPSDAPSKLEQTHDSPKDPKSS